MCLLGCMEFFFFAFGMLSKRFTVIKRGSLMWCLTCEFLHFSFIIFNYLRIYVFAQGVASLLLRDSWGFNLFWVFGVLVVSLDFILDYNLRFYLLYDLLFFVVVGIF